MTDDMSKTPRTNSHERDDNGDTAPVYAFARQLERELDEAVKMLRELELATYESGYNYCLICKEHMGHSADCKLKVILEKYGPSGKMT